MRSGGHSSSWIWRPFLSEPRQPNCFAETPHPVSGRITRNASDKPREAIDDFVFELYGLDNDDAVVVRDTLTVGAPYQLVRGPAELPPGGEEARFFCSCLEDINPGLV